MNSASPAQPDITLLLNTEGVIQEVTLSDALAGERIDAWIGRPWAETLSDGANAKLKPMIPGGRNQRVSVFSQVTQCFPSGRQLLMEYTTVRLGDKTETGLVAIGKSLQAITELHTRLVAAQQTMERDYWKLREIETRYRLLFDASNEAVLLLRADDLQVIEANPAAVHTLAHSPVGKKFLLHMPRGERAQFQDMLLRVKEQGKAPATLIHIGKQRKPYVVRASLMPADLGPAFLLQLTATQSLAQQPDDSIPVEPFIDHAPEGFVVINECGEIRRLNQAFLDMTEMTTESRVINQPLSRWLSKPGADLTVLLRQVQQHGTVRLFASTIHGELGSHTEVEISAARNGGAQLAHIGLLLRDTGGRLAVPAQHGNLAEDLIALVEQVGQTSLRQLVKETTGVLERHYIKAALELTGGNRTAAAEILGLSRQSLYVKLNQHGIAVDNLLVSHSPRSSVITPD